MQNKFQTDDRAVHEACPYCGQDTELVTGRQVYPHRRDLWRKQFYVCWPCDARVGCHGTTANPLGRLANKELRNLKSSAHAAFDPLWRDKGMSRKEAYAWLSNAMEMSRKECHIGMFNEEQCKLVVAHVHHQYGRTEHAHAVYVDPTVKGCNGL